MKRRTLLQWAAGLVTARPLTGDSSLLRTFAPAQVGALTPAHIETLRALAPVVLPMALDAGARDEHVRRFAAWFRNYSANADAGHGYGNTRLRRTGPSPVGDYPAQFAALDTAATARGAESFSAASVADRRAVVEIALEGVNQLPSRPNGRNLVADFMGFFFQSGDGWDLCYRAAIGRDDCRGLAGSDEPPRGR